MKKTLKTPVRSLLILGVVANPAFAAISDTIHPYVGAGYSYEDNLLRLSDGQGVQSDTVRQLIAGVELDRPIGRQRFSVNAKLSKVSYQHFQQLNYDGKDLNANWYWVVGNDFDGTIGASYLQVLSSFNDFHSSERNLRIQRGEFAELNYHINRRWKLRSRFSRDKFSYDLESQRYLDRTEDAGELALDYQTTAGSAIGLQARRVKGEYPFPRRFGQTVVNDGFEQDELKLKLFWNVTSASHVQFLGGRVRRSHEQSSVRDSTGTNGRLAADWSPLPQLKLMLTGWRDFVPYEGVSAVNYAFNKGTSISAHWSASAKVQYDADFRNVKRDFAGLLIPNLPAGVADTTRTASVGVAYELRPNIQLGARLSRDSRTGSLFSNSYRSKGATIYANLQF